MNAVSGGLGRLVGGQGRADAGAVAGLSALVVALFAGAVFGGEDLFQRDIHSYWYPNLEVARSALREGSWPLWNPYVAFGSPLLPDPNFQLLYPPTWLCLVLPLRTYYKLFAVSHVFWGALGTYLLARRRLSPLPAFAAGAVFCCSGPLLSSVSLFHHFAGASWMPWVVLALDLLIDRSTIRSALLLGTAAGLQALAGSADMCLGTAVVSLVQLASRWKPSGSLARLGALGVLAAAFAFCLSAVQWLPALGLLQWGSRARLPAGTGLYWSLHPLSLVDLFVPRLVSSLPATTALRALLFESREPLLDSIYLGAAGGVLALVALLLARGRARLWYGAALLVLVAAALGRNAPGFRAVWYLPPFSLVRFPVKALLPASLLWALLVGSGLESWRTAWGRVERRRALLVTALAVTGALAAVAAAWWLESSGAEALQELLAPPAAPALAWAAARLRLAGGIALASAGLLWLRRSGPQAAGWRSVLLVSLCVGDLLLAGRGVNRLAASSLLSRRPALVDVLLREPQRGRVYAVPYELPWLAERLRDVAGWSAEARWALGMRERLAPPIAAAWAIAGSYDGDFTGLASPALPLLSRALWETLGTPMGLKLLQMGNVTHVVALHPILTLEERARIKSAFTTPIRVYRVPEVLPAVYVVGRARCASGQQSALILADPGFDHHHEVLLDRGCGAELPSSGFQGHAVVASRSSNAMTFDVETNAPGYAVAVEAHHPGWEASLDGQPVDLLQANLLFRAVRVPPGRHRVELRYRPPLLGWGLALTGVAVLAAVAALPAQRVLRGARQARGAAPAALR